MASLRRKTLLSNPRPEAVPYLTRPSAVLFSWGEVLIVAGRTCRSCMFW